MKVVDKYYALEIKTSEKKEIKTNANCEWFITLKNGADLNVKSVGFYDDYSLHDSKTHELVF